ncbi:uncharacterized protein LOC134212419 isoform X1 [Armigeres subalbatus]|uniref:uncharacterized protein LOC134212419 isoform X1 n=1 Tax=Armigeres subalbatus TaxID=124917 RepID=UPI002ED040B6
MHDPLLGYMCVKHCGRVLSSITSLRKHIISCTNNVITEYNRTETTVDNIEQTHSTIDDNSKRKDEDKHRSISIENNSTEIERKNDTSGYNDPTKTKTVDAKKLSMAMTLKWLSENGLARKVAFEINKDIKENIIEPLGSVIDELEKAGAMTSTCKELLFTTLGSYDCTSEYRCIQQLKKEGFYNDPIFITINGEQLSQSAEALSESGHEQVQGVLMPVKFMLQTYLESDGVFDTIMNSLKLSNDGVIRSLIDGSIWQERTSGMCCSTVIPINIYFDDFTTGDTSSCHSKSTSICAIYLNIPCMPAYLLGKLSNIITVGFIKTEDRKKYSNDKTLCQLIDLLINLEVEGITVKVDGADKKVFFVLGFVLGDNLGVNGVLNYVESFRANYFCRVCKRKRVLTETDVKEYPGVFRTIADYQHDVQLKIVSETGIKAPSIFNKIPSYHVTHNFVFDVMHDIFEGVCIYDLQHILYYFVYTKQYFKMSVFNERKNNFVYGNLSSDNIIHDIQDQHVKMKKIKCTASEMKTLITFLPLIIGSLVPEKDEVWQLTCALVKIVHITMLREIPFALIKELRSVISFHHELYVKLFQDTLKPKHHNLVHYPTAILKGGTLRLHWSMRFEAKHKESKAYCRVNSNRINMCSSIATKANFKFAYDRMNNNFIFPKISYDNNQIYLSELKPHEHIDFELNNIEMKAVSFLKYFVKCGTLYNRGSIFIITRKKMIQIFKIVEILFNNYKKLFILCEKFEISRFNEHLQSYELNTRTTIELVDSIESCESELINLHVVNDITYLRLCNYYQAG